MLRWILVTIAIGLLWVDLSIAENKLIDGGDCDPWISKIVSMQGQVEVKRSNDDRWQPVRMEDTLCQGDRLFVGKNSRAAIVLYNQSVIRIDQGTTIVFHGVERKKTFLMQLLKGAAHFFSRKAHSLKFLTPFVNGVVEGTEFLVQVDQEKTSITLFEGRVLAQNAAGDILLAKGQTAVAYAGQPPRSKVVVRPRDAVHWTLYYPPILTLNPESFASAGAKAWTTKVKASLQARRQGNLMAAFTDIDGLGDGIDDPRFFLYRADLLLSVGRTMAAAADLDRVLILDEANSDAMALRSIIAVVQNRKYDALSDAQIAVDSDPDAVAARLALSYAYQARFDLDSAYRETLKATKRGPDHAMAWARLAELRLSTGDLKGALKAAQKAVALDATLTHTQTVLGYAYLTRVNIKESKQAFTKAIEIDSAAPLPRLGLGLAKIRKGDLNGGRAEIEIAAGLDPGSSLLRSYLGKAYFDEKSRPLDGRQFEIAKTLDPQDPTPWYYDAIRKQAINKPVEALQDLQKSIALNDNRAVYRSRLLMDEDLAARSASMGRIYSTLNFEELALREGFKSLSTDQTNFSAHRLLSDTYSSRPRHDIARVSALLKAQLLQPINILPVQPQLAETNLFVLSGAGPASLSFNEFNSLFNRNRLRIQTSGVFGNNDTIGDEIVVSAVHDHLSLSVGQFFYETDGFRENNDLRQEIYNVYAQIRLTHATSIQGEVRSRDTERGDPFLRFTGEVQPTIRRPQQVRSGRFGFHHAFSSSSDLLGSLIYTDAESQFSIPGFAEAETLDDGYVGELQHLWHHSVLELTTGGGYLNGRRKFSFDSIFGGADIESDLHHLYGYVYASFAFPQSISWTLGLSANDFEGFVDKNQVNPKLGIAWEVFSKTTLRGAAFRVLEDTLIAKQKLEPTHVEGFNQFFEDILDGGEAIDVWNYGFAIDQKVTPTINGGIEVLRRELEVPYIRSPEPLVTKEVDWEEDLVRLYLYSAPLSWLAVNFGYQYELLDRGSTFLADPNISELITHRFPLGVHLFLPRNFSVGTKVTYVNQEGKFGQNPAVASGEDSFWVMDATLLYRLPNRWGTISIEGKNLLDANFKFQDTDSARPSIFPELQVLAKFSLAF